MQAALVNDSTSTGAVMAVSLELARNSWKIGLSDGRRAAPVIHTVRDETASERLAEAVAVIRKVREKWQLPDDVRIVVSHEAGQDGFWIARALQQQGFEVLVVDPASIPVARQARRAKTDRLDVLMLVGSLLAWLRGELGRMHVIRIPTAEEEDQRQLVRERGQVQKEIGQHRDRAGKLLLTVGCWRMPANLTHSLAQGQVLCHDGTPLPPHLQARLREEGVRLDLAEAQLAALDKALFASLPEATQERILTFIKLKGIGKVGATRLVLELFWRKFSNRRQVGSCVGLVPQPYDSGESRVDQGISKQGNRRLRALVIELSWLWLRYQPASAIATWFAQRTQASAANKRAKRIAIVAVARRLVIALWRYLEHGVMPEGAVLKAA